MDGVVVKLEELDDFDDDILQRNEDYLNQVKHETPSTNGFQIDQDLLFTKKSSNNNNDGNLMKVININKDFVVKSEAFDDVDFSAIGDVKAELNIDNDGNMFVKYEQVDDISVFQAESFNQETVYNDGNCSNDNVDNKQN